MILIDYDYDLYWFFDKYKNYRSAKNAIKFKTTIYIYIDSNTHIKCERKNRYKKFFFTLYIFWKNS